MKFWGWVPRERSADEVPQSPWCLHQDVETAGLYNLCHRYIRLPWVTLGYPGFMSVQWNQKGHGMQETLCFFVEERVSGQGGGPEDGAGEATEWMLWEVTRDETVVPGANACAHGKDAQISDVLRVCNARTRRRVGQPPKLTWGQSRYPSHQATRRSTTDNFESESRDSEASSDTIFILAFSIIMLNTDLLAASECSHLRSCAQQHVTILPHLDICPRTPTQGTILEWRKRCVLRSLCACLSDVWTFRISFRSFCF